MNIFPNILYYNNATSTIQTSSTYYVFNEVLRDYSQKDVELTDYTRAIELNEEPEDTEKNWEDQILKGE